MILGQLNILKSDYISDLNIKIKTPSSRTYIRDLLFWVMRICPLLRNSFNRRIPVLMRLMYRITFFLRDLCIWWWYD